MKGENEISVSESRLSKEAKNENKERKIAIMERLCRKLSVIMVVALLITISAPMSYAMAAEDPYLAYQTTESGAQVNKLKKSAERAYYKVERLLMNPGEMVDLCFINAGLWKNAQWTSSNPDVARVDKVGMITALSYGTTKITLTYKKKITNKKVSISAEVCVGEEYWGLGIGTSLNQDSFEYYELSVNENVELAVYGITSGKYQVEWETSDKKVVEVSGNSICGKKAGTAIVSAKITNLITKTVIKKDVTIKVFHPVQQKIDELLDKLGVKEGNTVYFTVNQNPCASRRISGHGCDNCNVGDIIQASWFKDVFKDVFGNMSLSTTQFPEHDVDGGRRDHAGQSCFGFACFAQWYVYAKDSSQKVEAERIAAVKFNRDNMEKYVQPGDVIRLKDEHSVLVYSLEKDGLEVIDCNSNTGNHLNCVIQKHRISYSDYKGCMAYINRVTDQGTIKIDPTPKPEEPTLTPEKVYGVLDLSKTNWKSYNVGLDVEMNANKEYTIYNGAELEILGTYTNSKGNVICHVYSYDLQMECYISKRYIKMK